MTRARALPTSGDVVRSFEPLRAYVESRIAEGLIPGAVIAVGRRSLFHQAALGRRALAPRPEPMTLRTIFDLASLTKPMVTGALAAELACAGLLDLDDPVERHLEETRGTDAGSPPLRMLLTHTAGFPAMNPLADYSGGKPRLLAAIAREPLEARPGQRFTYSDVGYILMQAVLEKVTRKRLDRLARELIFEPLGFRDTRFGTRAADRARVAPTTRLNGDRGPRRRVRNRGGGGALLRDAPARGSRRAAENPERRGRAAHDDEPVRAADHGAARDRVRHREPLLSATRIALLGRLLWPHGLHRRVAVD